MKKKFRTILLNESSLFNTYLSKSKTNKIIKRSSPYSFLEFSKSKENSYDSKALTINNFHKNYNQISNTSFFLNKNINEISRDSNNFPLIKHNIISLKKNIINFNGFLTNSKTIKKTKKQKNEKNLFNKNKKYNLINSVDKKDLIDECKNIYPKYIFLNNLFKIKSPKEKKKLMKLNIEKLAEKPKKIKIKSYKIDNEEYKNYIRKRVKLNFKDNFDSSFVHKVKTEYMVQKLYKKYPLIFKYETHLNNDEDEKYNEEKEDIMDENIINSVKLFKNIKTLLINQDKKYIMGNETKKFFENKENKINFMYDISMVPHFKNNFLRKNGFIFQEKLESENYIDLNTWRYLNKAKIKIQKVNDDKKLKNYALLEEEKLNEEGNNVESINDKDIEDHKKFKEKYDLYDIEDYLNKKKENQSVVNIVNEKIKKLFYGTFIKLHNKSKINIK